MAQSTILAVGISAATSTDVVLGSADTVSIGIFSESGKRLSDGVQCVLSIDTPGADSPVALLTNWNPVVSLAGPGTFRVLRPSFAGDPCGVFVEDGA